MGFAKYAEDNYEIWCDRMWERDYVGNRKKANKYSPSSTYSTNSKQHHNSLYHQPKKQRINSHN